MNHLESDNISVMTSWLEGLPFNWHPLQELGQRIALQKHDYIFNDNDPYEHVYLVLSGRIRLFITSASGEEKTFAIIGKNGIVGENGIFDNRATYNCSAITASQAKLIKIERKKVESALKNDFELTRQLFQFVNLKVRLMYSQLLQLSSYSAAQRICYALLQLVDTYGSRIGGKDIIEISFTHQELANLVSTSRVTVANTLKSLEKSGHISKQNGKYAIEDKARMITLLNSRN